MRGWRRNGVGSTVCSVEAHWTEKGSFQSSSYCRNCFHMKKVTCEIESPKQNRYEEKVQSSQIRERAQARREGKRRAGIVSDGPTYIMIIIIIFVFATHQSTKEKNEYSSLRSRTEQRFALRLTLRSSMRLPPMMRRSNGIPLTFGNFVRFVEMNALPRKQSSN